MTYGHRGRGPRHVELSNYGQAELGVTGRIPWGLVFTAGGFWLAWKLIDRGLSRRKKKG
jgi:hypothetical protein